MDRIKVLWTLFDTFKNKREYTTICEVVADLYRDDVLSEEDFHFLRNKIDTELNGRNYLFSKSDRKNRILLIRDWIRLEKLTKQKQSIY